MNESDIGVEVRKAREASGLGQTALAGLMRSRGHKWTQPTVVAVEKGDRPLRFSEAVALAEVAGFGLAAETPDDYAELVALKRKVTDALLGVAQNEARCNEENFARNIDGELLTLCCRRPQGHASPHSSALEWPGSKPPRPASYETGAERA